MYVCSIFPSPHLMMCNMEPVVLEERCTIERIGAVDFTTLDSLHTRGGESEFSQAIDQRSSSREQCGEQESMDLLLWVSALGRQS